MARVLRAHLVQNPAHCRPDRARPAAAVRVHAAHLSDREADRGAAEEVESDPSKCEPRAGLRQPSLPLPAQVARPPGRRAARTPAEPRAIHGSPNGPEQTGSGQGVWAAEPDATAPGRSASGTPAKRSCATTVPPELCTSAVQPEHCHATGTLSKCGDSPVKKRDGAVSASYE